MAHGDIEYYVLINDEMQWDAHRNLNAPESTHYDGINKYWNFDVPSLVQTLEGTFAGGGNPTGMAFLRV